MKLIDHVLIHNVKCIMQEKNILQKDIAKTMGISAQVFSNIICLKRMVYADEVIPLALALNVTIEELFRTPAAE